MFCLFFFLPGVNLGEGLGAPLFSAAALDIWTSSLLTAELRSCNASAIFHISHVALLLKRTTDLVTPKRRQRAEHRWRKSDDWLRMH